MKTVVIILICNDIVFVLELHSSNIRLMIICSPELRNVAANNKMHPAFLDHVLQIWKPPVATLNSIIENSIPFPYFYWILVAYWEKSKFYGQHKKLSCTAFGPEIILQKCRLVKLWVDPGQKTAILYSSQRDILQCCLLLSVQTFVLDVLWASMTLTLAVICSDLLLTEENDSKGGGGGCIERSPAAGPDFCLTLP